MMVLNAAEGFSEKKEWLGWLIHSFEGVPGHRCHGTNGIDLQVGQEIGRAGTTGLSTGVHLHFGVRPIGGEWIDPLNVLP